MNLQGILHEIMLVYLLFYKFFVTRNKEVKYIRHFMLYFLPFWVVTSTYYYSSMKDKYKKFYVSSSCLSTTLQFTAIIE